MRQLYLTGCKLLFCEIFSFSFLQYATSYLQQTRNLRYRVSIMAIDRIMMVRMLLLGIGLCWVLGTQAEGTYSRDPVTGERVLTQAFRLHLHNGQIVEFASKSTYQTFLRKSETGLGGVQQGFSDASETSDGLCPVCGMQTTMNGPQVFMKHGDQSIHTCSMTHAHYIYDDIQSYLDEHSPDTKPTFCSGPGTTMLNGFSFGSSNAQSPCLLLWFPGWVLSTKVRYFFSCLFVAAFAVFNEYILSIRRTLRKEIVQQRKWAATNRASSSYSDESAHLLAEHKERSYVSGNGFSRFRFKLWISHRILALGPDAQHLVHCLLHGITILVAYLLMLVSMTYDWMLFLSIILGYVIGYYLFGERRATSSTSSGSMDEVAQNWYGFLSG
uniref:Copper transport protein n=1 Tax=Albugo laibachii Nc14 TaxID=890382 RepID=F0WRW5_9STRA|nr:conserved hypothetical protein [Albugo laibachii Nc14]|eukprot:CCA24081.1 conserved hypothetical protein [Albugo laibachii Nc14]